MTESPRDGLLVRTRPSAHGVADEVGAHAQCRFTHLLRVAVHLVILPTVAEVAFVVVETDQPALHEQPKPTGGQVVVLVDFGQALGKVKLLVINRMVKRHFNPLQIRKHLGHRRADKGIHPVVVADVEEAT